MGVGRGVDALSRSSSSSSRSSRSRQLRVREMASSAVGTEGSDLEWVRGGFHAQTGAGSSGTSSRGGRRKVVVADCGRAYKDRKMESGGRRERGRTSDKGSKKLRVAANVSTRQRKREAKKAHQPEKRGCWQNRIRVSAGMSERITFSYPRTHARPP